MEKVSAKQQEIHVGRDGKLQHFVECIKRILADNFVLLLVAKVVVTRDQNLKCEVLLC